MQTVKELIGHLSKLDQNLAVMEYYSEYDQYYETYGIEKIKISKVGKDYISASKEMHDGQPVKERLDIGAVVLKCQ